MINGDTCDGDGTGDGTGDGAGDLTGDDGGNLNGSDNCACVGDFAAADGSKHFHHGLHESARESRRKMISAGGRLDS